MPYSYSACATEHLIDATLDALWPAQAQESLGELYCPSLLSRKIEGALPAVVRAQDAARWEWETERFEHYTEDGEKDSREIRTELSLSDSDAQRVDRNFAALAALCKTFGIPADLKHARPDGEASYVQIRPAPSPPPPGGRLFLAWERDTETPGADLETMLELANNASSLQELREELRLTLDAERAPNSVEQALPAFKALWPGDSFRNTAEIWRAGARSRFRPEAASPEALAPFLGGANAQGLSPLAFALLADSHHSWRMTPLLEAANALARQTTGENQLVALDALSRRFLARDGGVLGPHAAPFLEALSDRFERGEPIDFSGPIGRAIEAPLAPAKADEQSAHALLEASLLKAQTLPILQARQIVEPPPPARSVIRV